ncbi:DUF4430 domain-containing protein [Anaerotignum sp.]
MNRKTGILAAILIILCIGAGILFHTNKPEAVAGAKEIDIIVIHADQTENTFIYQTDAEYLGDVLLENELAEGEMGSYGLFITAVDGETADDSKQQWWCITKSGESVTTGADALPIADGDQFELTLMEGY